MERIVKKFDKTKKEQWLEWLKHHLPILQNMLMSLNVEDTNEIENVITQVKGYLSNPENLRWEKFDTLFNIEASLKADTAYNYEKKGLWKLIGNVRVENLEGKKFETSLLFWDQKEEKVYSDKYIRIQEDDKIITGIGFESNQNMTQYKIFNSQGVFPVRESVTTDSTQNIVPVDSMPIAANPAMETVPQKQPAQKEKVVPRKLVPAEMDKTK